ncbi:MAG: hypothetical protein RJQ09_03315 [Cyclobacteriaceae bacterium]
MRYLVFLIVTVVSLSNCGPNREVSVDQGPGVREIHDSIELHFDEVTVNGVEYLILEKDRNNPDEGFGFMALKGNLLVNHTDSAIAYLRTMLQTQTRILAKLENIPESQVADEINLLLKENMAKALANKPDSTSLTGRRKAVNPNVSQ